jgi:hypothetical protein
MKTLILTAILLCSQAITIGQTDKSFNELVNQSLSKQLDSIYFTDQNIRLRLDSMEKIYNWQSQEMQLLLKEMMHQDSINLSYVKEILDKYGWLSPEEVGKKANNTLFLVIQHADHLTQVKYLPMMRDAVKKSSASGSSLALLEDRVAIDEGKKQIYGSQLAMYFDSNEYFVLPLEDPDNVDKRRAEVGLQPIAQYLERWGITWNVEKYKKELPDIIAKEKARRNK